VDVHLEELQGGGGTKLTYTLAFRNQAGRDHVTKHHGLGANSDNIATYLQSWVDARGAASD
jgi:hypothetical protein